jgi:hypothetical protein
MGAGVHQTTVRQNHLDPLDEIFRHAVLQAAWTAGALGDIAADGRDTKAAGIRREVEGIWLYGCLQIPVDHPRLNDGHTAVRINLQNSVHQGQREYDPAGHRERSPSRTGRCSSGNDRHSFLPRSANHIGHLPGGDGFHHQVGEKAHARRIIGITIELPRLGEHLPAGHDLTNLLREGRTEFHE